MTETCYMCEAAPTSREHVPPKCLFPESKDVNGQNFRENLITVPSCDIHIEEIFSADEHEHRKQKLDKLRKIIEKDSENLLPDINETQEN